jgi:ADP-ribose pyrophosphatase YjhB (NUDIX family)
MSNLLLEEIKKIKAISDIGLLYSNNEYDRDRYIELRKISYSLLGELSDQSIDTLKLSFPQSKDYPTPKVDIRGLAINEDKKILLVQESVDGKWSLPGGWADIGYSAKETIIKEFKEETGLDVVVDRMLAVFDKKMHPHPPQPFYVYKIVFLCKAVTTAMEKGFDVLDVQYFDIGNLPPLSEDRILKSQIELLYDKAMKGDPSVYFD